MFVYWDYMRYIYVVYKDLDTEEGHMRYVLTQIADDSNENKQSLTNKKITLGVNDEQINQCLHVTVKKELEN